MRNPWLYIHGFNSSSGSHKAQLLKEYCQSQGLELHCPDLSYDPQLAEQQLQQYSTAGLIIGSSLGGFYALLLASQWQCPVVLINPALWPDQQLAPLVGPQQNYYSGQQWQLLPEHLVTWQQQRSRLDWHYGQQLLLLQTGDQVIPFAPSVAALPKARVIIEQGGDHGFQGLERYYPLLEQLADDTKL